MILMIPMGLAAKRTTRPTSIVITVISFLLFPLKSPTTVSTRCMEMRKMGKAISNVSLRCA